MKKILLVGNSELVVFGFRSELIVRLMEEGFEVVTAFPKTVFGDGRTTAKKIGCEYIELSINSHGVNPFEELSLIHQFDRLLGQVRPDIVLTYTIKPNIYLSIAAKRRNIPVLVNVSGLGIAVEQAGVLQHISTMLYRYAMRSVHTVFFQNQENMDFFLRKRIGIGKHRLLPGSGVNIERFHLLDYPQPDCMNFVYISRIMKEKGILNYIEAAEIVKEKHPEAMFYVVGPCESEEYETLLRKKTQEGVVRYESMKKDVIPALEKSICLVHPTYYPEGLSNVLLESLACGRPIITTNRSGCREIIDDGRNGFVCKANDSQDLAVQIEKFIQLPYEQKIAMGLTGRDKVKQKFNRDIVVSMYLEEVKKALNIRE